MARLVLTPLGASDGFVGSLGGSLWDQNGDPVGSLGRFPRILAVRVGCVWSTWSLSSACSLGSTAPPRLPGSLPDAHTRVGSLHPPEARMPSETRTQEPPASGLVPCSSCPLQLHK